MSTTPGIRAPHYRLPDAAHPGTVRLQVADLARSLSYYETVLGLRVLHRAEQVATLAPQGDDTPLVELHERVGARPVPRGGHLGLYHFAILLPDRASLGRFLVHLNDLGVHSGMSDHAVSEAIYLTDPDGLGIEVYADHPRDTWRADGQQLYMTTAPLDVGSVTSAAGNTVWQGMPAGTRMGHIHLHVGDLRQASAFYHETLGFDAMVWGYPGALFLAAGGYHHHLGTNTWVRNAAPPDANDARLLEWELVLPSHDDVIAAGHSLTSAGHTIVSHANGWTASDPWGTSVSVRANQK